MIEPKFALIIKTLSHFFWHPLWDAFAAFDAFTVKSVFSHFPRAGLTIKDEKVSNIIAFELYGDVQDFSPSRVSARQVS